MSLLLKCGLKESDEEVEESDDETILQPVQEEKIHRDMLLSCIYYDLLLLLRIYECFYIF